MIIKRKRLAAALQTANGVDVNPPPLFGNEVEAVRQIISNGQKPPSLPELPSDLTVREREIAPFILEGKSSKEIAAALFISYDTVKNMQRAYSAKPVAATV